MSKIQPDPAAAEVFGAAAPPLPEPLPADRHELEPWLPGDVVHNYMGYRV